jgi:hypothetical protein
LARCALSISHPNFAAICPTDPELISGLNVLCNHVAKDHKLCNWVNHPMPGYPEYQNRIWKWDYRPDPSDRSATRKGWRLFAYVADPTAAEPIPAVAFLCYDKAHDPGGNYPKFIIGKLRKFLAGVKVAKPEERFKRQTDPDGRTRSLCLSCFASVCVSADRCEIEAAETAHCCPENSNCSHYPG